MPPESVTAQQTGDLHGEISHGVNLLGGFAAALGVGGGLGGLQRRHRALGAAGEPGLLGRRGAGDGRGGRRGDGCWRLTQGLRRDDARVRGGDVDLPVL